MDKKQLIDIILNDLTEVTALVKSLNQEEDVNEVLLRIALSKAGNVIEELQLLKQLPSTVVPTVSQTESKIVESMIPVKEPILPVGQGEKETVQQEKIPEIKEDCPVVSEYLDSPLSEEPLIPTEDRAKNLLEQEKPMEQEVEVQKVVVENIQSQPKEEVPQVIESVNTPEDSEMKEPVIEGKMEEPTIVTNEVSSSDRITILADSLQKDHKTSVNDRLGNRSVKPRATSWENKPIADLRRALSINDRFRFQRELFNGNSDRLNDTLNKLNQCQDLDQAIQMLKEQEVWDWENDIVVEFISILERRF